MDKVLQQQVEDGFERRNTDAVCNVFAKFKQSTTGLLCMGDLPKALKAAHARTKTLSPIARLTLVCASQQQQQEEGLDEEAFTRLVQGADKVQTWLDHLPLSQIVADSFPQFETDDNNNEDNEDDVLHQIAELDDAELEDVIKAAAFGLRRVLREARGALKKCFDAQQQLKRKQQQQSGQHTKFTVQSMASGSLADFHDGLAGRIGFPDMDFENSMKTEHCSKYGSKLKFTTSNYNITTTPQQEWNVVVNRQKPTNMEHGRRIPNVDVLVNSEEAKRAGLTRPEVIALVLYTGPMFLRYNTMLRRFPDMEFYKFSANGNLYTTTIFVLVSAVQKLARVSVIAEGTLLYRGLGGLRDLPERFVSGEASGAGNRDGADKGTTAPVRGMTEWGFMSTTANKSVALQYSGAVQGRPKASVMVMEPNGVDRGASIQSFSQYPGEAEFLWVPCSFIQPHGQAELCVEPQGLVTMVHVRVSANLKGDTVEELLQRKKRMHLTSFATAIDDLKRELWAIANEDDKGEKRLMLDKNRYQGFSDKFTVSSLITSIVDECKQTREKHKNTDVNKFVDNTTFRGLVGEMLETVVHGKHKFQAWLQDNSLDIAIFQRESLQLGHRRWIQLLRRRVELAVVSGNEQEQQQAALEVLHSKGLLSAGVHDKNSAGESVIVSAARDGWSREDMKMILAAGGEVNSEDLDSKSVSPIYAAAEFGNVDCLDVLIEAGGRDVNGNNHPASPLWIASCNGHASCIERLVAAGATVHNKRFKARSPLTIASENGHHLCVAALLAAGADVHDCDEFDFSAVWSACEGGHHLCVDALVAAGADVNKCRPDSGTSPVWIASTKGYVSCLDRLVTAGADVNKPNNTGHAPVWIASQNGHDACVARLAAAGADVNVCDKVGVTPLHIASQNGHHLCIEQLIAAGADANKRDELGFFPLHLASQNGHHLCIDRLAAGGADVNQCNADGFSPVYSATYSVQPASIERLVAAGADVNICSRDGVSPLFVASRLGQVPCVEKLIAAGADVNKGKTANGVSPVWIASQMGFVSCIEQLVAAGADVNKCRDDGVSALLIATNHGHTACVERLIAAGADVNKPDRNGQSPLFVAESKGHEFCVEVLRKHGAHK